jgi:hypothetical protein
LKHLLLQRNAIEPEDSIERKKRLESDDPPDKTLTTAKMHAL